MSPDMIAEEWAVRKLGMRKAKTGQRGHDGVLPCGRKIEIKSKKYGAHSDSATYVDLSEAKVESEDAADFLLVVFVDYETREVVETFLRSMNYAREIAKAKTTYRIMMSDFKKPETSKTEEGIRK
ncbi:MAG: hypothetical protein OXC62_05900 [Aestuariivita sp.]|nr:hypothetical protein [Aestuariivita sp.]